MSVQRTTRKPSSQIVDFRKQWTGKLRDLTEIRWNKRGICGCSICGQVDRVVKGMTFRDHMIQLHSSVNGHPASSHQSTSQPTLFTSTPTSVSLLDPDHLTDHGQVGFPNLIAAEEAADQLASCHNPSNYGGDGLPEIPMETDSQNMLDVLATALNQQIDHNWNAYEAAITPPPSPSSLPHPLNQTRILHGATLCDPLDDRDFLGSWPYPLPHFMFYPSFSALRSNPFKLPAHSRNQPNPFLQQVLPLLTHALSGMFNTPRRACEMVLQISSSAIKYAQREQHQAFIHWYEQHHPTSPHLGSLLSLEQALIPVAPKTQQAALKQLSVDDFMIVHPQCSAPHCSHVFYSITSQNQFEADLPVVCPNCTKPLRDGPNRPNTLHFPRRSLHSELEHVLQIPGVELAIERSSKRKRQRDEEDQAHNSNMTPPFQVLRQQDDGSRWANPEVHGVDGSPDVLSITVNLGIDWASANSHRSSAMHSMGPITLTIADLPPQLRSSLACALLVGITPGPTAPLGRNLWKLLLPLCLEIRDANLNGLWVRTAEYPTGRLVYVRLGCLLVDRPAAVEITGAPHFSGDDSPCLRCSIHKNDITTLREAPLRDYRSHHHAMLKQAREIDHALAEDQEDWRSEQPNPTHGGRVPTYPPNRMEAVVRRQTINRGHLSSLVLIPDYDLFAGAVFDPMHCLLEGLCKTYYYKVLTSGSHGLTQEGGRHETEDVASAEESADENAEILAHQLVDGWEKGNLPLFDKTRAGRLHDLIKQKSKRPKRPVKILNDSNVEDIQSLLRKVVTPSSVVRLHDRWGSKTAGSPSANHWRAFAAIYGPLVLPLVFLAAIRTSSASKNTRINDSELAAMMSLFEIISLSLRSSISTIQIDCLETLIKDYQRLVFDLHPSLFKTSNFHVVSHLPEDICAFGPCYGWWCFFIERINYIIKNTNRSGSSQHQAQVVAFRAVLRSRSVVSARMRACQLLRDRSSLDDEAIRETNEIFDTFSTDSTTDILEKIAFRYAEVDGEVFSNVPDQAMGVHAIRLGPKRRVTVLPEGVRRRICDLVSTPKTPATIDPTVTFEGRGLYVSRQATVLERVEYNGRRLVAAQYDSPIGERGGREDDATLFKMSNNSSFTFHKESSRFRMLNERGRAGVICHIFEHQCVGMNKEVMPAQLYASVRMLEPHIGIDLYGYRAWPNLEVWTWEANKLKPPVIVPLTGDTLAGMRPIAHVVLPRDPNPDVRSPLLWVTVPLHIVSPR